MIPAHDYVTLGIVLTILGGLFGIILGVGEDGIFRRIGIGLGGMALIGLVLILYYSPIEASNSKLEQQAEDLKEASIKQLDCKSIQKYLLDSLPNDNTTTKYAHSVFDLKCKGVSTT